MREMLHYKMYKWRGIRPFRFHVEDGNPANTDIRKVTSVSV